jgi:fumarate reductase flavoprotein subunit
MNRAGKCKIDGEAMRAVDFYMSLIYNKIVIMQKQNFTLEVNMKLHKPIVILGILALVLAGCASTGGSVAAPIGNATGTASATAAGFGGDIIVTITMADGYITDVQVVGDAETPTVGGVAITRAPGIIKKNNSGLLDAISGATITSGAISTAVQEAIDKIAAGN